MPQDLNAAADSFPQRALPLIRAHMDALPPALQRIGKYILENPDLVTRQTATDLGLATKSGPASIVRFCRAIGFDGLQDFKYALAGDLTAQRYELEGDEPGTSGSNRIVDELSARLIMATRETRSLFNADSVDRLADALIVAKRIDVYGAAASGIVAQYLAFRLLRVGLPAHAIVDPTYAAYVAAGLGADSVAVAISESGMTHETVEALKRAKSAGALTAVITHRPDGPIVKYSDEVLLTAGIDSPVTGSKSILAFTNLFAIEVLASVLTLKLDPAPGATDPARGRRSDTE